jgi:hypothetical protein
VVDAVDLALGEDGAQRRVESPGRLEVGPEGLFDDDPRPGLAWFVRMREAGSPQVFGDPGEVLGRGCEIEEPVAVDPLLSLDLLQTLLKAPVTLGVVQVCAVVEEALREALPHCAFRRQ